MTSLYALHDHESQSVLLNLKKSIPTIDKISKNCFKVSLKISIIFSCTNGKSKRTSSSRIKKKYQSMGNFQEDFFLLFHHTARPILIGYSNHKNRRIFNHDLYFDMLKASPITFDLKWKVECSSSRYISLSSQVDYKNHKYIIKSL